MYSPKLDEFQKLAAQGNLIPVTRRLLADIETPLSAYRKIRGAGESFLFESVEGGEHIGRYSFVGCNPRALIRQTGNCVEIIENGKTVETFTIDKNAPAHSSPSPPRSGGEGRGEVALRAQGENKTNLPDLILIDGGKGQLGMAVAELKKLGLEHIPVIGLAKEYEEIYQPGKSIPLRLSHDMGALKLLQRVRDESHRFANTYNAQLRLKRISESILDEFPNIGERRKAALLKKFGSVQRMRLATVEQIAEVSGFGGKAAAELKTFLEARSSLQAPQ